MHWLDFAPSRWPPAVRGSASACAHLEISQTSWQTRFGNGEGLLVQVCTATGHAVPVNAPLEPIALAENGRFVVAEAGPRVMLIDRGPTPADSTVRLLAISALIFGGFGVVSLINSGGGGFTPRSLVTGVALLGIAIASFVAMNRANRLLHRARGTPLGTLPPLAVFDRAGSVYVDHNGEIIAQLSQVRCTADGFGSAKLVVVTPDGPRVMATGNPVTGGLGNLAEVLNQKISGELPGGPST